MRCHNPAIPVAEPLKGLAAPPVFVVGQPRSGTTWMFEVLESHPEAAGVFESWMFHDRMGVAGLFDPAHWDDEVAGANTREIGRPLGLAPLLDRAELVEEMRVLTGRWLARALRPGDRYLVEKSPVHLYFAPLIAELFPDARFVEMIRDGRDAAISRISAWRGWNPPSVHRTAGTKVCDVARDWRTSVEMGDRNAELLGERWLRVRFEDLRDDFEPTVARTLSFCGMPADTAVIAEMRAATELARHSTGESKFRRGGRVGQWRTRFSLREARDFDRVAGDALVATGYEQDRSWWHAAAVPRYIRARRDGAPSAPAAAS